MVNIIYLIPVVWFAWFLMDATAFDLFMVYIAAILLLYCYQSN